MSRNDDSGGELIAILVLLVVGFAIAALYGSVVYGDWTCAFSNCVRIKP